MWGPAIVARAGQRPSVTVTSSRATRMLIARPSPSRITSCSVIVSAMSSGGGGEAMAEHHGSDRREVGRPTGRGVEDGRSVAEVAGAEDAGGDDRERPGVVLAEVVEPVHRAARDAERLARGDVDRRALDRPGQDASEPVDRLLVAVVAVCGRHLRADGNVELEDGDRP